VRRDDDPRRVYFTFGADGRAIGGSHHYTLEFFALNNQLNFGNGVALASHEQAPGRLSLARFRQTFEV
jgi:hypothetical protein